jgi:hypothetical protein
MTATAMIASMPNTDPTEALPTLPEGFRWKFKRNVDDDFIMKLQVLYRFKVFPLFTFWMTKAQRKIRSSNAELLPDEIKRSADTLTKKVMEDLKLKLAQDKLLGKHKETP